MGSFKILAFRDVEKDNRQVQSRDIRWSTRRLTDFISILTRLGLKKRV